MTIVLNLPLDKEQHLKARAAALGQDVEDYAASVLLADVPVVPAPTPYDPAAAIALLETFAASDEYGTAEEQRETFAYLERVVEEDRPGQRSVFGKGINPLAPPITPPNGLS